MMIMQGAYGSFPQSMRFRMPVVAERHAILQARASLVDGNDQRDFSSVYISLEQAEGLLENRNLDDNLEDFFEEYCSWLDENEDVSLSYLIGEFDSRFPTRERFFARIYGEAISFLLEEGICRSPTSVPVDVDSSEQAIGLSIVGLAALNTELRLSTREDIKNHPKIIEMATKSYRAGVKGIFQNCFRAVVDAIGREKVAPNITL